jgi:hypothetical protein
VVPMSSGVRRFLVPLVNSPTLTRAKLAANQANGRRSHGPATQEGIERIRAANTRHGFYSKAPGSEMRLLGEDPEQCTSVCTSRCRPDWEPENEYQTSLVRHMARLMYENESPKARTRQPWFRK